MTQTIDPVIKAKLDSFVNFFKKNYVFNKNGKIKSQKNNRYFSNEEVYRNYSNIMSSAGVDFLTEEEFDEAIKRMGPEEEPVVNLEEYIQEVIEEDKRFSHNLTWTQIWSRKPGTEGKLNSEITDVMNMILAKRVTDPKLRAFDVGDIDRTFRNFVRKQKEEAFSVLGDRIKYDKSKQAFIGPFLRKIHEHFKIQESFDIFALMMCHWAWQVKRRVYNKKVIWHIWINFFGPTGTGKSWFIDKLSEPFEEFYVGGAKISDLLNETKEVKKFTEAFIVYFDELAINKRDAAVFQENLSQDDIKTLKSVLTSDKLQTRVYGTQEQMKRDITFTCISSANEHFYDVVFDPETMRRYFEFNCAREEIGTDEELQSLNEYLDKSIDFWQAIDESREEGYWNPNAKLGKKIWNIQKTYYPTKSSLTTMAKYFDFVLDESISTMGSYKTYQDWCKSAGYKSQKVLDSWISEVQRRWPNLIGSDGKPHIKFTNESRVDVVKSDKHNVPEEW
jgi:hypothetical protein